MGLNEEAREAVEESGRSWDRSPRIEFLHKRHVVCCPCHFWQTESQTMKKCTSASLEESNLLWEGKFRDSNKI